MTKRVTRTGIGKVWHNFIVISYETFMMMLFSLPRYSVFNFIKSCFLKLCGAKVGKRVIFYPGVIIVPGRNLEIGDDVDLSLGIIITSGGGVRIGDRTLIGFRTQIISSNHIIPNNHVKIFYSGLENKRITIGRDVWIGANCLILPGVNIGEGAVVAGGCVVTKDVEPFTVVGGVPAKVIRVRS